MSPVELGPGSAFIGTSVPVPSTSPRVIAGEQPPANDRTGPPHNFHIAVIPSVGALGRCPWSGRQRPIRPEYRFLVILVICATFVGELSEEFHDVRLQRRRIPVDRDECLHLIYKTFRRIIHADGLAVFGPQPVHHVMRAKDFVLNNLHLESRIIPQ